ncbi:hypothetical protein DXB18_08865 [Clostridium sp. OM02-18AC]|nr:hypothetical protein DXB18_08865 [Clostridium sp. OM02-18AC]
MFAILRTRPGKFHAVFPHQSESAICRFQWISGTKKSPYANAQRDDNSYRGTTQLPADRHKLPQTLSGM